MASNEFSLTIPDLVAQQWSNVIHEWCGNWAIAETEGMALHEKIQGIDLLDHMAKNSGANAPKQEVQQSLTDGIAVVDVVGVLQRARTSLGGTSTVMLRQTIKNLAADQSVKAIMLRIDSPGGLVAGTDEAAQAIAAAAKSKPVWSYISDLGASAAYWLASQTDRILVNRMGEVGSIGVYMTVVDSSARAAQMGIKVHKIGTGTHKGAGTPGTEITADHLAEWQAKVNETNQFFLDAVATGRKQSLEVVKSWADGRVHVGQNAVNLGLADGVASFEEAMSALGRAIQSPKQGTKPMSAATTPEGPKAATLKELKQRFPQASAEWREKQIEAEATLEQASQAYIAELQGQLSKADAERKAAEERAQKLQAEADEAAKGKRAKTAENLNGNVTATSGSNVEAGEGTTATAQFQTLVSEAMEGLKPGDSQARARAFKQVKGKNPELYQKMMEESGARKVPRAQAF